MNSTPSEISAVSVSPLDALHHEGGGRFHDQPGWGMPMDFGNPEEEYAACRRQAAVFDFSLRGKIEIAGAGAAGFLNNLSTNDIKNLAPGEGCEAFFTTLKAKVVAQTTVYHVKPDGSQSRFWIDTDPGQADALLKHLDHFLISEQVEWINHTADLAQIHAVGPQAPALVKELLSLDAGELKNHEVRLAGDQWQLRRKNWLNLPGFDLVLPSGEAAEMWKKMTSGGFRPAGWSAFNAVRIQSGQPLYGIDIDGNTMAPEVNRIPQTICYTKGCYLGQEPIVRARDLGHVNKALHALQVDSKSPIPSGVKILDQNVDAGWVTSSALVPGESATVAMGFIRRGHAEFTANLEVETAQGRAAGRLLI